MYMPDPVTALRRIHQALKPDGRIIVGIWGERRQCVWSEIFPIVDSVVQSEVCPLFFSLGSSDNLALAMAQAGFLDVQIKRRKIQLKFTGEDELLKAMIDGGPVAMAAKRFDDQARLNVEHAFLKSVAQFRQLKNGYELPSEVVFGVGHV
jgi:SAM-dependent methyltransferase